MISHPRFQDLQSALAGLPPDGAQLVRCAYETAERAHDGQLRDEGTPFIEHPLRVALIVALELRRHEPELLCAALLHDVVEDSSVREADVRRAFGHTVAHYVGLLTKEKAHDPKEKREITRRYLKRIEAHSPEAMLLKLADRLDNLRSLEEMPDWDKRNKYIRETYWLYMPFAERAGAFFHRQYLELLAGFLRRDGERIGLKLEDYPEWTGGVETRRDLS